MWNLGFVLVSVRVILRRGGIELPAMLIAIGDLICRLELLVVFVGHAERLADIVDAILVWRRVVASGRLVSHRISIFPVGVDITAGHDRAGLGVIRLGLLETLTPAAGG